MDEPDVVTSQTVFRAVVTHRTVFVPRRACSAVCRIGDPQTAFFVFEEETDPCALDPPCVGPVKNGESDAVKPDQSLLRTEPDIAVAALHQAVYPVLRQAVFLGPVIVDVLVEGSPGLLILCREDTCEKEKHDNGRRDGDSKQ